MAKTAPKTSASKAAKTAPAAVSEISKTSKKTKIPFVSENDIVKVTTDEGVFNGTVVAVHGGNKLDVTVHAQVPVTLGSVAHESATSKVPYWE